MKPSWHRYNLLRALISIVLAFVTVLVGARLYGAYRWNVGTKELRARLDAARVPVRPQSVDFGELEGLPAPVERYFRLVLKEEQPMVAGVRVQHSGGFNMGETTDRWKPFTSNQEVVTRQPGFDWDARVALVPGVLVRVHDAYVAGEGILQASLLGLFPLANMGGGGDIAEGELMRFFAEAAWYPTALLPSQGVHWETANDRSAFATLTEGTTSVTMLFTFDEQGLISTVGTEARPDGARGGRPYALAGSVSELRRAWRYAGAAGGRGGLAATRRRKALLAR